MEKSATTNFLLLVVAVALIAIAVRPLLAPPVSRAQVAAPYAVYIEPGTMMLRSPDGSQNVYGRMVVDLQTGKIWGFPTLATSAYPVEVSSPKPPVSHPFLLGTFAFGDMEK